MIELCLHQGSPEWHAARAKCFNASEAPAMMGVSKYTTRSALLRQKATGIVPEVDANTQRLFDRGHETEAMARPLAEKLIGKMLAPLVATDDSGKFMASSDGVTVSDDFVTLLCDIGFEHKFWNEEIAALVAAGEVPESHKPQLDHQFLVFNFEKILFVCSDGTPEKFVHCWYYPDADRIARLRAGWEQFEKDMAEYQHVETAPAVVAAPVEYLPAVSVQVSGAVSVVDNLDRFGEALRNFLDNKLVRNPKTDQDFADLEEQIKALKKAEDALDKVEEQAIAQVGPVEAMKRTKEMLHKLAREHRLMAEKLLKAEKDSRRVEIITAANRELSAHLVALQGRVGVLVNVAGNFADAIKGLKSLDSMREKVSVALANAKISANALADLIDANRKTMKQQDAEDLFPDFAQVCTKAPEDFAALIAMRVSKLKEMVERRQEEERAKAAPAVSVSPVAKVETQTALPAANETQGTLKLGEICMRLGFTMTADFLAGIGIAPVATEKNAKLYRAADFTRICTLLIRHIDAVANGEVKKAA